MAKYPLVTILTPTWNRGPYLLRVWEAIAAQTYSNIEWIVGNDGSTDGSADIVYKLARNSAFPIVLINASVHIGKARMDNEAIAQAKGEFILWNDSDDYLLPNAIEQLVNSWNLIPETERLNYIGVTGLCSDGNNVISTPLPYEGEFSTTWNDLAEKYHVTGDMLNLTKTSELKAYPFPEVDLVIPEGVIWTSLGDRKVKICPQVLQIKEYRAINCISFTKKMEYCRGRAYAMAVSEGNIISYPRNLRARLWKLITYIRLCIHGEICLQDQMRMWGFNSPRYLFFLMWPFGFLLAIKDWLQGKVRRTHREFLAASKLVAISYNRMGGDYN